MEQTFTSGGPGRRRRLSSWIGRYRLPLALSIMFFSALAVLSAAGGGTSPAEGTPEPAATGATERAPVCAVCGLGAHCDPNTGRCVLDTPATREPCAKGSSYDEEGGYCRPDPTPKPTPLPSKTLAPNATIAPVPSGLTPRPASTPRPTPPAFETPGSEPTPAPSEEGPRS